MKAYHGTNKIIDFFSLEHVGKGQGQSSFPGIYFSTSLTSAKEYAKLAAQKNGGKPLVYEVELDLEGEPFIVGKSAFFRTRGKLRAFLKQYFPDWLEETGDIKSIHIGYVNEKFSSAYGQYSLLNYAAIVNNISPVDIVRELGFTYALDGSEDIVITDPNQIDSYTLLTQIAREATAQGLLNMSKGAEPYNNKQGNRYTQRVKVSTIAGRQEWQQIDINKLFKTSDLLFHIPVQGETNYYVVELEIKNYLEVLKAQLKTQSFTIPTIKTAIMSSLMTNDVKSHCNCEDFRYRFDFWVTQSGDNSGTPQSIRSDKTNPADRKGRGCKHILYCLSNRNWSVQIARTIFNYVTTLAKTNVPLFTRIIQPALDITVNKVLGKPEEPKLAPTTEPIKSVAGERLKPSRNKILIAKEALKILDEYSFTDDAYSVKRETEAYEFDINEEQPQDNIKNCYNKTDYVCKQFKQKGLESSSYFIQYKVNESLQPYHTFLVFENSEKYYWAEHAWSDYVGLHEYNSLEELLADVQNKFMDYVAEEFFVDNFNEELLCMLNYPRPPYTLQVNDVLDFIHQNGNPINQVREKRATKESYYGGYYTNANLFDDDQTFMLQIASDRGVAVSDFVTPKNSPEQIGELIDVFEKYAFFTQEQKTALANPDLPFQSIKVLAEAFANKINLSSEALKYDSKVLLHLLKARKLGIPIEPRGLNFRQIEQLIIAYKLDSELFSELYTNKYNYEQMRGKIKEFKETAR